MQTPKGDNVGFRVKGLNSFKWAYVGDCIGEYYMGYQGGYSDLRRRLTCWVEGQGSRS